MPFGCTKSSGSATEGQRTEEFLRNYSQVESRIFGYILSLVANYNDAEEVFQETTLALWQSYAQFEPGTDFFAWARQVAYHRVLTFRKQRGRRGILASDRFLEAVNEMVVEHSDDLQGRLRALADCVEKLPERDRRLVALRYGSKSTIKHAAEQLGSPANTLYKALERIRHALMQCVDRSMAREEHA